MTTSSYSYGSFRRAEEASNAQGTTKAASDWAQKNAEKNPTRENIAIAKQTYAAYQATAPAPIDINKIVAEGKAISDSIGSTIDEANVAIGQANVAMREAAVAAGDVFNPLKTVSGGKTDSEQIDAFALLEAQLRQWKLDDLANAFISLATQGFKPQEAMNKIKYDGTLNPATGKAWNADYKERFAGNEARTKQGLNVYTEAEYLTLEDSYADTLRRNNLNTLLSTDAKANQKKFAGYMEKGLSATEFADRIDTFFERVESMNPNIKGQFKAYYPGIDDLDIVAYLADPENTMPVLNKKIAAAEIGASALQVGLKATSKAMAETMAGAGVTRAEAQKGYAKIGEFLSDAELYSQIYKQEGINYNQETAEKDILLNQADAVKKRKRLASMARAGFEGSSGRARTGQPQTNSGMF
jgi:hypothetical protein